MAVNKRAAALAAAKQKKQKMIAIGGLVVLLALLAFSVPKTLKMLKGPQPVEATPTETAPTPAPVAPGTPTPAPATPLPQAVAGELVDTGSLPEPTEGQFISFERFASKDPFAQQVAGTGDAAPAPSDVPVKIEQPELPGQEPPAPTTPATPATPETPAPQDAPESEQPARKPASAVLTINGVRETVEVGAEFPKDEEIFELVALTPTSAKIAIAGGSLTGGGATFTLEKGKKVTLMNTADGTQYELVLISLG